MPHRDRPHVAVRIVIAVTTLCFPGALLSPASRPVDIWLLDCLAAK
jgi:hypothetical protein